MRRLLFPLLLLALACPASASAAPTVTGEFDVAPDTPGRITQGPDGDMWVVLGGSTVGEIAPNGDVTKHNVDVIANIVDITSGPGNKLWVSGANGVASFSAADPAGTDQFFPEALYNGAQGIAVRGDELWVANGDQLYHAPLDMPAEEMAIALGAGTSTRGLTSHGGFLWVADAGTTTRILAVTPGGTVTPYPVGGMFPQEIAGGPGAQVAYTSPNAEIGRITPDGTPLPTNTGAVDPFGIAFGADGAYWTANFNGPSLSRLTPDGQYSTLTMPAGSGPRWIAAGPNNTLWVSLETSKEVARVSGVEPPAPPSGGGGDTVAPRITGFALSATRFRLGSALPRVAQKRRVRTGTTIRFTVDEASRVTLSFTRLLKGKRVRGRCVKRRRANRRRRSCVRRVAVKKRLSYDVQAGRRRIRFAGRLDRRRKLKPGRYVLTLRAVDAAGNRSTALRKRFTLLPAKKRKR